MGLNKRLINQASAGGFGTDNFAPVTYTGNRPSTQSITGVGFQPDLVWIKNRDSSTYPHVLTDSVRGNTKYSVLDTSAQYTGSNTITSFDSDGFSLGDNGYFNGGLSGAYNEMVAWCWKGGGAAVSNTDGSITSQVSANPDAGFSIVKYDGTGVAGSYGHGLSSAPEFIITKNFDWSIPDWFVYHKDLGTNGYLRFNKNTTEQTASTLFSSAPSATVVNIGNDSGINRSTGDTQIAYCFHSVDGYQKFGTYAGTGSVSGPTITLGFQPRFFMVKQISPAYGSWNWYVWDSARGGFNDNSKTLQPSTSNVEDTTGTFNVDFTSTGVFLENSPWNNINQNGGTFLYWAIA